MILAIALGVFVASGLVVAVALTAGISVWDPYLGGVLVLLVLAYAVAWWRAGR